MYYGFADYLYSIIALGIVSFLAIIVIIALSIYVVSLKKRRPEQGDMIDFKKCCLYVVLVLPGSVETQ